MQPSVRVEAEIHFAMDKYNALKLYVTYLLNSLHTYNMPGHYKTPTQVCWQTLYGSKLLFILVFISPCLNGSTPSIFKTKKLTLPPKLMSRYVMCAYSQVRT